MQALQLRGRECDGVLGAVVACSGYYWGLAVRELQPRKVGQTHWGFQKSWGSKPTWSKIPGVLEEETADSILERTAAGCGHTQSLGLSA